jgi:hypothetical protein
MARARNIKPGLFKNEVLGTADPFVTLLFEGLWLLADKEGRLEDRPLRIRAELFPYREGFDINGYLTQLLRGGFIERYTVDKIAIIQIVNFRKHQSPHVTEKPSELPAKPEGYIDAPLDNGEITEPPPPDSLIPDSLIPDSVSDVANATSSSSQETCDSPPPVEKIPFRKIVALYHEILPMCPRVGVLTNTRKGYISARWKSGAIPDLETWRDFFTFIGKSKFLTGQVDPPPGKKRFVADLEWMTRESNFVKIYEKKYHGPQV